MYSLPQSRISLLTNSSLQKKNRKTRSPGARQRPDEPATGCGMNHTGGVRDNQSSELKLVLHLQLDHLFIFTYVCTYL